MQSQGDPCALIVIDWAIKSLNFQLDDKAEEESHAADASQPKHTIKNAHIYASYINVVLANFGILHEPWQTISISPKLISLLEKSPGLGLHALVNLVGRLCQAVLREINLLESQVDQEQQKEPTADENRQSRLQGLRGKLTHYQ